LTRRDCQQAKRLKGLAQKGTARGSAPTLVTGHRPHKPGKPEKRQLGIAVMRNRAYQALVKHSSWKSAERATTSWMLKSGGALCILWIALQIAQIMAGISMTETV